MDGAKGIGAQGTGAQRTGAQGIGAQGIDEAGTFARTMARRADSRGATMRVAPAHGTPDTGRQLRRPPGILERLWTDEAAIGLSRRSPELSARNRSFPHLVSLLCGLVLANILAAPALPFSTSALLLAILAPTCLSLALLRMAGALNRPRYAPRHDLSEGALPKASIIVALYREAAVIPQLIKRLAAIDYPADKLEVRLVLEADDGETLAAIERCRPDARFSVIIAPAGHPRTKPRALNYALRFCSGEIVAVHDAEDRPHPNQLRHAAESFSLAPPRLVCLQAPLNWYNRNETWLTRQFAMEYAAHFHVMLPLYQQLGWPLPLGGTSNYFRVKALRRSGGWDAWNVTEDADLGVRLHRLGYRCGLIAPPTLEEAPVSLHGWTPQRTRWLKGYWQTLGVHFGLDAERRRLSLPLVMTLGGAVLSALIHGPTLAAALAAAVMEQGVSLPVLACLSILGAGYAGGLMGVFEGMARAGLPVRIADLALLPVYWSIQFVPAVRALVQLVQNPYLWEKTEHGVSSLAEPSCTSPCPRPSSPSRSALQASFSPAGGRDSPSDRNAARG